MSEKDSNSLISIVVPVYNESGVIQLFIDQVDLILKKIDYKYEIIFIDDGSTDNTFLELENIYKSYENIRVIKFSRNFGKEAAISE